MKVIHIESGLGNQMLSYCEYLALQKSNPAETFYIENIVYDIPECNDIICQWNGYELGRIFGINASNIRDYFSDVQWQKVMGSIRNSQFWLHNWNWPVYFQRAFEEAGLPLNNMRGDFEANGYRIIGMDVKRKKTWMDKIRKTDLYYYLQMKKIWKDSKKQVSSYNNEDVHFYSSEENELTGQRLTFKYINSGIERIEDDIRKAFTFPVINDEQNAKMMEQIKGCNSVAIHARRGDMMGANYPLYRFGYFKRCVSFIRSKVPDPEFYIFCDPGSVQWAKDNAHILGLNFKKDKIHFIDWNKGQESFRDMQLMAACKHQVVTRSSFGWWATWLNNNPQKITCSPSPLMNTTNHF